MPDLIRLMDEDAARIVDAVDLSPLDDRSILITGASGLLGITILACLRERMRRTGRPIAVTAVTHSPPPAEFAALFEGAHFRLLQCDLADPVAVRSLPGADHIIHAAGYGQPGKFLENPAKTILLNTMATAVLLEALSPGGKFLCVSSSEVYSCSPHGPHREDDSGITDPSHRRACYIER